MKHRILALLLAAALLQLAPAQVTAKAPPGRYQVDAAAGTVYDAMTKLTWQRSGTASGSKNWAAAADYCKGAGLPGAGWRLPTITELRSIVDLSLENPAIDPVAFPNTPLELFWSSTKLHLSASAYAWGVQFADGNRSFNEVDNPNGRVRCVR